MGRSGIMPKGQPRRGASRDRTLPGKRRIRMRRFMKWHDEYGEQGLYAGMTYREIEQSE